MKEPETGKIISFENRDGLRKKKVISEQIQDLSKMTSNILARKDIKEEQRELFQRTRDGLAQLHDDVFAHPIEEKWEKEIGTYLKSIESWLATYLPSEADKFKFRDFDAKE